MARTKDLCPLLFVEAATLIFGMGNGIALVAVPWLVLELTGRATAAGNVPTATLLPLVVSSVFSGTVGDLLSDLPDISPDETDGHRIVTSWAH